jgi:uncharacterized membrane-anchored protein YjiN (DUF445 family)
LYNGVIDLLREISADPNHELRGTLSTQMDGFVDRLRSDPELGARIAGMRDDMLEHPELQSLVAGAWDSFRSSLRIAAAADQRSEAGVDSRIVTVLERAANTLRADDSLRVKIDGWVAALAQTVATDYGHHAAELIRTTIEEWDAEETSNRIEQQIGKDLQYIRINGTLVGALVGLLIHTVSELLT